MFQKFVWVSVRALGFAVTLLAMLGFLGAMYGGSAPLWSQEAAGWAQAVGSIAAIIAAFYIGERQSKISLAAVRESHNITEKKRIESLVGMAEVAESLADLGLNVFPDGGFTSLQVAIAQIDDPLDALRNGLDAIPLHEIGSAQAVAELIFLRTSCGYLQRALDRAETYRASTEPDEGTFDWYSYDTGTIRLCCGNIVRSCRSLTEALGRF